MSCIPINDFSLISLCDATKAGKLYSIVPDSGAGDFDVTRASTATYLGSDGLLKTAANDEPRIEFNADGSYKGLLVEPAATNLETSSNSFSVETAPVATIVQNQTDPFGNPNSAWLLSGADSPADSPLANNVRKLIPSVSSGIYTASLFVKSPDGSPVNFRFRSMGIVPIPSFTISGDSWFRVSVTPNSNVTSVRNILYTDGGLPIIISGLQVETGSVATSYIPTVASTVTRAADVISKTGASALIGQQEGTLYAECNIENTIADSGVFPRFIEIREDNVNPNLNTIRLLKTGSFIRLVTFSNGSLTVAQNTFTLTSGVIKLAIVYKAGEISVFANGSKQSYTTFVLPLNLNMILIGALQDHIKSAAILPTALSDQAAINLTS